MENKNLLTNLENKISSTLSKNNSTLNLLSAEYSHKHGGVTTFKLELTKLNDNGTFNKCLATINANYLINNTEKQLIVMANMKNTIFSEADNGKSAISTVNETTDVLSSILSDEGQDALFNDLVSFTTHELQKIKNTYKELNETHTQLNKESAKELLSTITSKVKELRGDKSIATFRPASIDFQIKRLDDTEIENLKIEVAFDHRLAITANRQHITKNDFESFISGAYLSKNVTFNETKPVSKF